MVLLIPRIESAEVGLKSLAYLYLIRPGLDFCGNGFGSAATPATWPQAHS